MADSALKNLFAPAGMVAPPRKTEATDLPAPETKKVAGINMDTPPLDMKANAAKVRELSK